MPLGCLLAAPLGSAIAGSYFVGVALVWGARYICDVLRVNNQLLSRQEDIQRLHWLGYIPIFVLALVLCPVLWVIALVAYPLFGVIIGAWVAALATFAQSDLYLRAQPSLVQATTTTDLTTDSSDPQQPPSDSYLCLLWIGDALCFTGLGEGLKDTIEYCHKHWDFHQAKLDKLLGRVRTTQRRETLLADRSVYQAGSQPMFSVAERNTGPARAGLSDVCV